MWFDSKFTFNVHVDIIVKRAHRNLGFLVRITKEFNNEKCLQLLFNTLVRPGLEFASTIWTPFQRNKTEKIEKVQRKFTRILTGRLTRPSEPQMYENYEERMLRFKMCSLVNRRIERDMGMLYKLLNNKLDVNIEGMFSFRSNARSTRFNGLFQIRRVRLNSSMHLDPFYRLQCICNSRFSSVNIYNQSFAIFKRDVKTILYR